VVDRATSDLKLVDDEGHLARARVLHIDKKLDLALVYFLDADNRTCDSGPLPNAFHDWQSPPVRVSDRPVTDFWLERVASEIGGVDRYELSWKTSSAVHSFFEESGLPLAKGGGRFVEKGHSGAPVMGSTASFSRLRPRYDTQGQPIPRPVRNAGNPLVGIQTSIVDGRAAVVRGELVTEFIGQALAPVDWHRVALKARGAKVVRRHYGPSRWDFPTTLPPLSSLSNSFSLGLDWGMRDFPISSIRVRLGPAGSNRIHQEIGAHNLGTQYGRFVFPDGSNGSDNFYYAIEFFGSQYSYQDAQKNGISTNCRPTINSPEMWKADSEYICRLNSPMIVRSSDITFHGDPARLREIELLSE
jgi:hypothetical protein